MEIIVSEDKDFSLSLAISFWGIEVTDCSLLTWYNDTFAQYEKQKNPFERLPRIQYLQFVMVSSQILF